jgi:hypothetical protein
VSDKRPEISLDITEAEANATMANPLWRIRNLYSITDKQGHLIPFVPNAVQEVILKALFSDNERRLLVLKSRKHGVSTLFEIIILDLCYFGEHIQASIVDLTYQHASDKLVKIIRFAWEQLDPEIREKLLTDSNKMIEFKSGSNINAGKGARGGQNQILHISEWGPIAHEDPERSTEIKTGALPSADEGIQFIESTFKGGKGGDFYDLIKRTMETPPEQRTVKDFKFMFFAWFEDDRNTLEGDLAWISKGVTRYLAELEAKLGITLTPGQKMWYFKTSQEQGIFMRREYPSTPEEAFNAPVEGAIFGEIMSEIRTAGHIIPFGRDRSAPVYASWDIGWDDCTSVWLIQPVGRDLLWIWHYTAKHVTAAQVMGLIDASQIPVAGHILPHDAFNKNPGDGACYADAVEKAGGVNIIRVPRIQNLWTGIDLLRNMLARSWFNRDACEYGINALESYHTKDQTSGGTTSKDPVHDWASHPSSAARYFAEATELGLVKVHLMRPIVMAPRSPDGDVIVDLEFIRQNSIFKRRGLAKSGTRRT